jgi:hypothetical protein
MVWKSFAVEIQGVFDGRVCYILCRTKYKPQYPVSVNLRGAVFNKFNASLSPLFSALLSPLQKSVGCGSSKGIKCPMR